MTPGALEVGIPCTGNFFSFWGSRCLLLLHQIFAQSHLLMQTCLTELKQHSPHSPHTLFFRSLTLLGTPVLSNILYCLHVSDSLPTALKWRRAWQPAPVFLPGESHGQRSLVGYSPWVAKSRTRLSDWHTQNATPLRTGFYFASLCFLVSISFTNILALYNIMSDIL